MAYDDFPFSPHPTPPRPEDYASWAHQVYPAAVNGSCYVCGNFDDHYGAPCPTNITRALADWIRERRSITSGHVDCPPYRLSPSSDVDQLRKLLTTRRVPTLTLTVPQDALASAVARLEAYDAIFAPDSDVILGHSPEGEPVVTVSLAAVDHARTGAPS